MKLIDELRGFAVLTGPLWLILLLLPVCIWLAVKISKRFKPGITRIAGSMGIFLLLFALPFGDEIAGRVYFDYLCATEAGVKVYQTVELPAEYWDQQGAPKFIRRQGSLDFDESTLGKQYGRKSSIHSRSSLLQIDRDSYQLLDMQSQKLLGENVNYVYRGGWVSRALGSNTIATGCSRHQVGYFTDVLTNVFKPANFN